MHFLVDNNKKIIFGWSAKCGCSHLKLIYWFLQTGDATINSKKLHTNDSKPLPNDIQNYTTIIVTRNPYKRIVSGFLRQYNKQKTCLPFSQFVDRIVNKDWKAIDSNIANIQHHFGPQTSENFDKKILLSKNIKFYDLCNIDYEYIGQLYNKKIPDYVINRKMGHEREKKDVSKNDYVYDLNLSEYIDYNVDLKYFYNEEIKEKVFNFFINDFTFFKDNGIDYMKTDF